MCSTCIAKNILSIIASSVLLYCDAQFLRYPSKCFWPGDLCSTIGWDYQWTADWNNFRIDIEKVKLTTIRCQLSCAVAILFLSILHIGIYINTSLKVQARATTIDSQTTTERSRDQLIVPQLIPV